MPFYAGKIAQQPELANPTLVVLTDRNDLDDQLFGQFCVARRFCGKRRTGREPRGSSRRARRRSGHIVFTTIQKFLPEARERYDAVTDRRNVIVIADEAHRSHYGFAGHLNERTGEMAYGFARHLRDALPNASFIGFTGTPVEKTDHNTRTVFGDYIDIYDVRRAVDDGATVPIYYEAPHRQGELRRDATSVSRRRVRRHHRRPRRGRETPQRKPVVADRSLVGRRSASTRSPQDIVEHFERRQKGFEFDGKAMIVCMSRRICARLYQAIVALRPTGTTTMTTGRHQDRHDGERRGHRYSQPHIRNKAAPRASRSDSRTPTIPSRSSSCATCG